MVRIWLLGLFSDFLFIIFRKLIADGLPPRPFVTFQEPNFTPPTSPSLVTRINCPKTPSKRKYRSSINSGFSEVDNFKEYLQTKVKKIKNMRSQKLSRLQAGRLASQLAQDLLEVNSFKACLKEEHRYMLELSLLE